MGNEDYYCYLITAENRTYIGMTNDLERRLLQHNGILKGGAKATRMKSGWKYRIVVGVFNRSDASIFEYMWKQSMSGIDKKTERVRELLADNINKWPHITLRLF
jgi:putative endonuclease